MFGGGHVVLPLLSERVVDTGMVESDRFLAGYAAAQAVPGPLFTFAAYLGAVLREPPNGVAGGASSRSIAIFLPSFLLVWGALPFWSRLRRFPRCRRRARRASTRRSWACSRPRSTTRSRPPRSRARSTSSSWRAAWALLALVRLPAWAVVVGGAAIGLGLEAAGVG